MYTWKCFWLFSCLTILGTQCTCSINWYIVRESCFGFVSCDSLYDETEGFELTFEEARRGCISIGGNLATLSRYQQRVLKANSGVLHSTLYWVGLRRNNPGNGGSSPSESKDTGDWVWLDDTSLKTDVIEWREKPRHWQSCAKTSGTQWIGDDCNHKALFICELGCSTKQPPLSSTTTEKTAKTTTLKTTTEPSQATTTTKPTVTTTLKAVIPTLDTVDAAITLSLPTRTKSPTSIAPISAATSKPNTKSNDTGAVAGGVVAGVLVIAVVVAVLLIVWLRKRRRKHSNTPKTTQAYDNTTYIDHFDAEKDNTQSKPNNIDEDEKKAEGPSPHVFQQPSIPVDAAGYSSVRRTERRSPNLENHPDRQEPPEVPRANESDDDDMTITENDLYGSDEPETEANVTSSETQEPQTNMERASLSDEDDTILVDNDVYERDSQLPQDDRQADHGDYSSIRRLGGGSLETDICETSDEPRLGDGIGGHDVN